MNLNYFISDAVLDYVIEAVRFVGRDGWRFLTDYTFDPMSGLWRHRAGPVDPPVALRDVAYDPLTGAMVYPAHHDRAGEPALAGYLAEAHALAATRSADLDTDGKTSLSADFEHLRWFELPACCVG